MIFSINPRLLSSNDPQVLRDLAKILSLFIEEKYLIDINNLGEIFFDSEGQYNFDQTFFAKNYIAINEKGLLLEWVNLVINRSAYITELHYKYLTTLSIGLDPLEIPPNVALQLVTLPSKIIVENATNDWKFICGIATKYSNHKQRKEIYKLIKKAIDTHALIAEQAGGKGQIKARIIDLSENSYKETYKYKLAALFDSDRANSTNLNPEVKIILTYLKGRGIDNCLEAQYETTDRIIWHMFYKRELENYVPINIIIENITLGDKKEEIEMMPSEVLDFLQYKKLLAGYPVDVKNEFPELFLKEFTRDKFEERCEHHKVKVELPNNTLVEITEVEQILLKIAKLI